MTTLNLTATGKAQELVLAYLQENASETLIEKINHGVVIEKDGKRVRNKKTLDGFMQYACGEAKKLAEKGAGAACIEDATVYGWAMHYFEEDSIEGTLYNEDGTPYKPAPAPVKKSAIPTYTPPAPKPKPQISIFDDLLQAAQTENTPTMSEPDNEETDADDEEESLGEETDEDVGDGPETEEADDLDDEPEGQGTPFYQCYKKFATKHPDAVLFMRIGDFYEALGDHAVKISDVLDLTLTGRECGLSKRVPMCGIPYHALERNVAKLLEREFTVAIAEDMTGYHFAGEDNILIDPETGEVFSAEPQTEQAEDDPLDDFDTSVFDKEVLCTLFDIFGNDIDVR